MYRTNTRTAHHRSRGIIPGLLVVAIAVSSCVGTDASADDGQACRLAQRLVDETADGDLDGIDRQLDRLEDLDGIEDRTDLNDLEDLTEIGDEDALDDIADQVEDDLDCDIDIPRIVEITESAPADTVAPPAAPPATSPPVTEPAATTPPAPEPPATAPPATEPPATTPPATTPPATEAPTPAPAPSVEGQPLAVVEVGADTPVGLDMADIAHDPTALIAEAGVTSLPIPAGEAIGFEYDVSYTVNDFSDSPEHTVVESASFVAATSQTIEQVRDAFSNAIITATGVDYDLSESTASRDDTTQSAVDLRPDRSTGALRYEVVAAESTESPGLVFIEITATGNRAGPLPALTAAAAAHLDPAIGIGSTLGWELANWSWRPGINQFSGDQITSGRLGWAIGTGVEADVAVESAELLALIPTPEFDDISSDSEFYILNSNEDWSVRHSDVFEGAELRAAYGFTL